MTKSIKKSKSYIAIQESAKTLFWKHGIRRVTVEEICREAGVSKMSFYRNFSNKNEVAEQVLKDAMEDGMANYEKIMLQNIAFPAKIKALLTLKRERSKGISQEFLKDIYLSKEESFKKIIENYRQKSINRIMEDMKDAQEKGWIRKDLNLSFLLYMLTEGNERLFDEKLISMYEKPEDAIMDLTNFYFYGILSKDAI